MTLNQEHTKRGEDIRNLTKRMAQTQCNIQAALFPQAFINPIYKGKNEIAQKGNANKSPRIPFAKIQEDSYLKKAICRPPTGLINKKKVKQGLENMPQTSAVGKLKAQGLNLKTFDAQQPSIRPKSSARNLASKEEQNKISPLINKLKANPTHAILPLQDKTNFVNKGELRQIRALSGMNKELVNAKKTTSGNSPWLQQKGENNISEPHTNSISNYSIGRSIGQGAYGLVKEATHKATCKKVAIKVYDKYRLLDSQRKNSVNREIQILQSLSHPNIVKLYETIDTTKQLYLVFELIKGRSLYSYLKSKNPRRLDESEARRIFKQVLAGVRYCHSKNVSHRDIKLENLLLDEQNNIKIIDFGFSSCVPLFTKLRIFCGTPSYMAPEIVNKKQYIGPPADVWALGVLLYAMLSGKFPFKGATDKELFRKITKGDFSIPLGISQKAKNLLVRLLNVDFNKRPTCDEIMLDPFIAEKMGNDNSMLPEIGYQSKLCSNYNVEIIKKIVNKEYYINLLDEKRIFS